MLLSFLLQRDRSWIIAHCDESIDGSFLRQWNLIAERRKLSEPISYLTGEKEFYGRSFIVNPSVLIPRPATEGLVEATLEFLKNPRDTITTIDSGIVAVARSFRDHDSPKIVADIGTGSGCIAVTLALERPDLKIIATDVSVDALKVARANAKRHGVLKRVRFVQGNLLEPMKNLRKPFLLVSNPPYVSTKAEIDPQIRFEPEEALFAGPDGTAILRPLLEQAKAHTFCTGVVIECGKDQAYRVSLLP